MNSSPIEIEFPEAVVRDAACRLVANPPDIRDDAAQ
jgi:hypothetical protein